MIPFSGCKDTFFPSNEKYFFHLFGKNKKGALKSTFSIGFGFFITANWPENWWDNPLR